MKRILVPTDFSGIAKNALNYAIELSKVMKAEIIIFHADKHDATEMTELQKEVANSLTKEPSLKITFSASHKQFSSLTVNEVINTHAIDLIVIGTSGQQAPLEKRLFGHLTTDIAEHANCPVIAVPQNHIFSNINKIAYASDINFIDKEIEKLVVFAKAFNASIEILHVSPVFPDLGDSEKMDVQKKIEQYKTKFAYSNINYSLEKTKHDNEILKGISSFIAHHSINLLVMFHNHLTAIDEILTTSNTAKVIAHIKTPILIYPKA